MLKISKITTIPASTCEKSLHVTCSPDHKLVINLNIYTCVVIKRSETLCSYSQTEKKSILSVNIKYYISVFVNLSLTNESGECLHDEALSSHVNRQWTSWKSTGLHRQQTLLCNIFIRSLFLMIY